MCVLWFRSVFILNIFIFLIFFCITFIAVYKYKRQESAHTCHTLFHISLNTWMVFTGHLFYTLSPHPFIILLTLHLSTFYIRWKLFISVLYFCMECIEVWLNYQKVTISEVNLLIGIFVWFFIRIYQAHMSVFYGSFVCNW